MAEMSSSAKEEYLRRMEKAFGDLFKDKPEPRPALWPKLQHKEQK